jgi:hypothetical protein
MEGRFASFKLADISRSFAVLRRLRMTPQNEIFTGTKFSAGELTPGTFAVRPLPPLGCHPDDARYSSRSSIVQREPEKEQPVFFPMRHE